MKKSLRHILLLALGLFVVCACQVKPTARLDLPKAEALKQDTAAFNFLLRNTQRLNELSAFCEQSHAKAAKLFSKKSFDQMTPAQQKKVLEFDYDYALRWLEENTLSSSMLLEAQGFVNTLRGPALEEFTSQMKVLATFMQALRMAYPNDLRLDPLQKEAMTNPAQASAQTPAQADSLTSELDSLRRVQEEIVSKETR